MTISCLRPIPFYLHGGRRVAGRPDSCAQCLIYLYA